MHQGGSEVANGSVDSDEVRQSSTSMISLPACAEREQLRLEVLDMKQTIERRHEIGLGRVGLA
jgi:hypothetical protein